MKKYQFLTWLLLPFLIFACSKEEEQAAGNPVITFNPNYSQVMYGDSLPFTVNVKDDVPLSTLKVRLYYGKDKVQEVVMRTKTNGDYSGKIYVPSVQGMEDGKMQLELVLQNIHFTTAEKKMDIEVVRPKYEKIYFVTPEKEYEMTAKDPAKPYEYSFTATMPRKIKGYFRTTVAGEYGNVMTFGDSSGKIVMGSESPITFSYSSDGEYTITFNTFDYSAAPFIIYKVNETMLDRLAEGEKEERYYADFDLEQNQEIKVAGIEEFDKWWIDPDFFVKEGSQLKFRPISGRYRIIADMNRKYLKVETMVGDQPAKLLDNGTGAVWIVGEGVGKPTLADAPSWNPNMAICMAPMGNGRYEATFVADNQMQLERINFVLIMQKGWGAGFKGYLATAGADKVLKIVDTDMITIGEGQDRNKIDNGNVWLAPEKKFTKGTTYTFVLNAPDKLEGCTLTVVKK